MGSIHKFLKSINYEDSNGDFEEASISCVKVNKKQESFEVFINSDKPINPVATLELIKCAKKGINGKHKCHVNFVYDDMSDQDILDAFRILLGELIIKRPSLVSLENKNINIDDDFIIIELDSRSEEYDLLQKEIKGLVNGLVELGFYEMEITTAINVENEKKIQDEIEADRNKEVEITEVEVDTRDYSNGKWTPKKKVNYSREGVVSIESIDQEENNVHLEAYIFGSEFNQLKTKDGRDIFLITLKLSDNTSSILAKSFAKDEEDFTSKSKELKDGNGLVLKDKLDLITLLMI